MTKLPEAGVFVLASAMFLALVMFAMGGRCS